MPTTKVGKSGLPLQQTGSTHSETLPQGKKLFRLLHGRTPELYIAKTRSAWGYDDDGKKRLMRYIVGGSTIWVDEQKKEKEDTYPVGTCEFAKGRILAESGSLLDEFLTRNINNTKNGGGVWEYYNPIAVAERDVELDDLIIDAKVRIRNKMKKEEGIEEVRRIAMGLHLGATTTTQPSVLRKMLSEQCEKDPNSVLNAFKDKAVKALAYIDIAETKGEIIYDGSRVKWAGGDVILNVPQGRRWKDYFAEYATHYDNLEIYKELDKIANAK